MNLLGNLIWIVFGGFFIFIEYLIASILLCITIIGIPFGIQVFKLSYLSLVPFGRKIRSVDGGGGCLYLIMNILWLIFGGIWIALSHAVFALIFAITIIGIPFARQHMKLAGLALSPFGKEVI